MFVKKFLG